jgi:hypothetical protein
VNAVRPRYLIENRTTDTTVRDLTMGIRSRGGRESLRRLSAPALLPGRQHWSTTSGLTVPRLLRVLRWLARPPNR